MTIGVPKEIKNNENRVALTPSGAYTLVNNGHTVLVEKSAGMGSGIEDAEYAAAGAVMIADPAEIFAKSDMIMKVKEPLKNECALFKPGQLLFTYLHLAPNTPLTQTLLDKKVTAIAYETVEPPTGGLPLLLPMSEVAGRMSIQIGAAFLQKYNGGRGVLLGGVPGVLPAEVLIVGGGIVGMNAAKVAVGMGANVTVLDISKSRLAYLDDIFGGRINTLICNDYNVAEMCKKADLLIGAVLVAGARAPKIVKEKMVKTMKPGSVIVDVAVDQGGCVETIDCITTHDSPTYERHGVIHYAVANMPGAVPRTSTYALESATLPYAIRLANEGLNALKICPDLLAGLNTYAGELTSKPVAEATGLPYSMAAITKDLGL